MTWFERLAKWFGPAVQPAVVEMRRQERGDSVAVVQLGDRRVQYRGCGTVWHRVPDGVRPSTSLEGRLSDAWTRAGWVA